MRVVPLAALAAAAMWFASPDVKAELASGEKAPNFAGKEFINSAKCDLKSLRGQVVLYEVFRTW
jgi:hypothetical protein